MGDRNYWEDVYWPRVMKRRLSRRRLIQIGALGTAGAVSAVYLGCSSGGNKTSGTSQAGATLAPAGTPKMGGTVTAVDAVTISSLDPALSADGNDKIATDNIFDYSVDTHMDASGSLSAVGVLAESWEWVEPTRLNMKYRQGVKFHDGTDFDASAVKYNVERVMDPKLASPRGTDYKVVDHLEQPDANTLTYVLKNVDYNFVASLGSWSGLISSPTAIEKYGDDYANHPTGTGPFMFKSQQAGSSLELVKNPSYWRTGEPYLDALTIHIISDKAVEAAAFKSGDLDADLSGYLDTSDVLSFQNDPGFNVVMGGSSLILRIYMTCLKPPLDNVHLRRAMSYAVNQQEFVSKYNGLAFATPAPLSRNSIYDNPDQPDPEFNLDKAKQEMKLAGLDNGISFELVASTDPVMSADAELLVQQLSKIGVNCKLVLELNATPRIISGNFDALMITMPSDAGSITFMMRSVYHSKSQFNQAVLSDPQMDSLIDQAGQEPDPNKQRAIYWQVMKIIMDNAYDIPLCGLPSIAVMRKNLQGYIPASQPGGLETAGQFREMWLSS
jgi:peptide/nickel transport system substrate-binding protein